MRPNPPRLQPAALANSAHGAIPGDVSAVTVAARRSAARSVNSVVAAAYSLIGTPFVEGQHKGGVRAEHGVQVIEPLAANLSTRYGKGFSLRKVRHMTACYLATTHLPTPSAAAGKSKKLQTPSAVSSRLILSARSRETGHGALQFLLQNPSFRFFIPWSAHVRLLAGQNENARQFYQVEAWRSEWSVRQFDRIPNKVLAAELKTALPGEKELAADIEKALVQLERRTVAAQNPIQEKVKRLSLCSLCLRGERIFP